MLYFDENHTNMLKKQGDAINLSATVVGHFGFGGGESLWSEIYSRQTENDKWKEMFKGDC